MTSGTPAKARSGAVVPLTLFLVGLLATLLVGPLVAPKGYQGWILVELDFYIGVTSGLALVLVWVVVRLQRQARPAFLSSTAVVAALFYVVMTATAYGWLLVFIADPPAQTGIAPGPVWFLYGILLGVGAALFASLVGGLALAALGRLRALAIVPGMVVGYGGVVLGFKVFENLFYTSLL